MTSRWRHTVVHAKVHAHRFVRCPELPWVARKTDTPGLCVHWPCGSKTCGAVRGFIRYDFFYLEQTMLSEKPYLIYKREVMILLLHVFSRPEGFCVTRAILAKRKRKICFDFDKTRLVK